MSKPLASVKDHFESKEKLVAAVEELAGEDLWVARLNKDRGGNRGLKHVSNAKLLRLHSIFTQVKSEFGTRAKLIDALLKEENRSKDASYRTRLEAYPVPRLLDQYTSSKRRAAKASSAG